jgi:hypothetical protein
MLFGGASGLRAGDVVQQELAGGGVVVLLHFFPHRGKAIEEQLAKVGQSDGVTAGDALAGELFDEIAEEEIHGIGGGEVYDIAEKLGGEGFGVGSLLGIPRLPSVFGTKSRGGISGGHAASSIARGMSTARWIIERFGVSGFGIHSFPRLERGAPPPPVFL